MRTLQLLAIAMILLFISFNGDAQPVLETGNGKLMPAEWIDKDTGHKIMRITTVKGDNRSFYFHNNPFIGDEMVFYHSDSTGRQLYAVNLTSGSTRSLTDKKDMNGEIVAPRSKQVFFQVSDSVFAVDIKKNRTRLIYIFPPDFKASVSTINADETILAGRYSSGERERAILKEYPSKGQYFDKIFDAKIPNTLFTIDIKTGEMRKIYTENTWIGHVQFSPQEPALLMFCHEGPWHKVDRIWTIDVGSGAVRLMHKRSVAMEIAGHEFFSADGKTIWYDLQIPRSERFYLGGTDVKTLEERKYSIMRNEWSIHFNISGDGKLFCGDGGDSRQVARAADGRWIYLFRPVKDRLISEKLVNMKFHDYQLEPNVHFSPDGQWIIFRANFEGRTEIYAVSVAKSKEL